MDKTTTWARYEERLSRITAYIHDHLDEEIDLQKLAEIACLSPYHWHRNYRVVQGETIAVTVTRPCSRTTSMTRATHRRPNC